MDNSTYTSIPDTTDSNYWRLRSTHASARVSTFVPIDTELHRSLLLRQREEARTARAKQIQATNQRVYDRRFKQNNRSANKGSWVNF